jgi:integration host factor subunit alpha
METITKEKIANLLKVRLGFSSLICEEITNSIFSEILDLPLTNKKLVLPNFGKFQVYSKSKRPGLNLQTREVLEIEPRKVLRFSPSSFLKQKINSHELA